MKDRKIKGRTKGRGWRQDRGGAKKGGGAKGGGGGAEGRDGHPPSPHEKKTSTKQNVNFIYLNCHSLLCLPDSSVT